MNEKKRVPFIVGMLSAAIAGTIGYTLPASGSQFRYDVEYPSIEYSSKPADNPVRRFADRLKNGDAKLEFRPGRGFLIRCLRNSISIPARKSLSIPKPACKSR